MNKDIEKAKKLLDAENLTCALCKGAKTYKSDKSGIKQLLIYIEEGTPIADFSAADKVIGKAAAWLFVLAKVREVYAKVMSKGALKILTDHNISASYGDLVDVIDGCKMEAAVENAPDAAEAYRILKAKFAKKLAFGLMRMPLVDPEDATSFDYAACEKMMDTFLENGFTHFDTAYVYHGGTCESMVKRCLSSRHARDKYTLSTKLPMWQVKKQSDNLRLFEKQLENCGVEYFDYYLLHSLNKEKYETVKKCKSFDFGFEEKAKGRIKNFGFSFHDTPELLDEILTAHPDVDFVLLQINYLDWENPSIQSRRCYETARKHNIPVMVMEPNKGGQLASVPPEAAELFRTLDPKASPASYAIRFAASLDGVIHVLSGMSTPDQMNDNISFMRDFAPLTDAEREVITKVTKIIEKDISIGCTACGYCVDGCPAKIAIPNYFALYNEVKRAGSFIPHVYYENISATRGKASQCMGCGLCEGICPQKLSIRDRLSDVAQMFEKPEK